jgi:hypothetical protein
MHVGSRMLCQHAKFGRVTDKHSMYCISRSSIGATAVGAARLQPPQSKISEKRFVDTILSKVLRDSCFSLNQPLKSADD